MPETSTETLRDELAVDAAFRCFSDLDLVPLSQRRITAGGGKIAHIRVDGGGGESFDIFVEDDRVVVGTEDADVNRRRIFSKPRSRRVVEEAAATAEDWYMRRQFAAGGGS